MVLSRGEREWGVRRAGQCAASSVRVRRCIEGLHCVRRSATPSRIKVTGGAGVGGQVGCVAHGKLGLVSGKCKAVCFMSSNSAAVSCFRFINIHNVASVSPERTAR